jgi:LPPG:FO 2-phospho-L-lactate transferase
MAMRVVALAGGVGGAKLADGLAQALPPDDLVVIVNTGDDFDFLGLRICPDLDTVCYTLAGIANPKTGWGRDDESWNAFENLIALGGPGWFRLGDKDLATHLERRRLLREGLPLSQITERFCQAWGIQVGVLPMSDDQISTIVTTTEGELPFQEYFVRLQFQPQVTGFRFDGIELAKPAKGSLEAVQKADLVVLCPSNPWVSIDPILSINGIREALKSKAVIAISPIIGGRALKGPAAKIFLEFGIQPSPLAVAEHYASKQADGILNGLVIDSVDEDYRDNISDLGLEVLVTETVINSPSARLRLAQNVLHFGIKMLETVT